MSKQFMAILAAVVVGLGIVFWISGSHKSGQNNGSTNNSAQPTSHIQGLGKKGVTLMEYGDYECPICGSFYPTVKQVQAKYNQEIYFQFRNLPLVQIHQNAFAGARAAEAAGMQNKYFEMHDLLYENQNTWSQSSNPVPIFQTFAQQLGLNITKFNTDYASGTVNDAIQADLTAFGKTGQQEATPTFFLDGTYIDNSKIIDSNGPSLSKFSALIDQAIAAKNK